MKVHIVSDLMSNRIEYAFTELLKYAGNIQIEFKHISVYKRTANDTVTIWYSDQIPPLECIHIAPSGYLYEQAEYPQEITVEWINDLPWFFKTTHQSEPILAFDLPAMVFYMLSRWEEYDTLSEKKDALGRFLGAKSFASLNGFLEIPVVDLWRKKFYALLSNFSQQEVPFMSGWQKHLTVDVDIAWSFLNKPLWITLGGIIRDIFSMNLIRVKNRFEVIVGSKSDPYDTFMQLENIQKDVGYTMMFFLLLGKRSKLDKNLPPESASMINLIQSLSARYDLGIHPSFKAGINDDSIQAEKELLEKITGKDVTDSRQHYLLIQLPNTYKAILKAGLQKDHSMIFHDKCGYRAGTSLPFQWYNLSAESISDLKIYPYFAMDVSLKKYMNLDREQAKDYLAKHNILLKNWNLPLNLIWHNSSFNKTDGWDKWEEVLSIH